LRASGSTQAILNSGIVQSQIASSLGVGFSINPITNNYDEAVFNSIGIGEMVVPRVTPDTFVVDTVTRRSSRERSGPRDVDMAQRYGGTEEKRF